MQIPSVACLLMRLHKPHLPHGRRTIAAAVVAVAVAATTAACHCRSWRQLHIKQAN